MPFNADWISASQASNLLSHRFHGRSRAQDAIAIALRENLLQARATQHSIASSDGAARVNESSEDRGLSISSDIWNQSLHWDDDRDGWDWAVGTFSLDLEPWPGDLHVFHDVHFSRDEIQSIDPDSPAYTSLAAPKPPKKQVRVSSPRYWDWDPAFADLVALASLDGLDNVFGDLAKRGNQAKLERWFAKWFKEKTDKEDQTGTDRDAPSPNECKIRARMVVGSLRSRQAGPR